ncbi:MAG: hypothetical protein AB7Q00_00385 [Phycisphaerales bacterium]
MTPSPTRMQVFFATHWPMRLWFAFVPLAFPMAMWMAFDAGELEFSRLDSRLWLAGTVLLSWMVGFPSALLVGYIVLRPILTYRVSVNGGPYGVGDTVRIISGTHAGLVSKVYSRWQGNRVRVDLGHDASEKLEDIFDPLELLIVKRQIRIAIARVELNAEGRLCVFPRSECTDFIVVWRDASSVRWNREKRCLHTLPIEGFSAIDEYHRIVEAVLSEYGAVLEVDESTIVSLPSDLALLLRHPT